MAAGVVLTADPITGDRGACVVTAVRGVGERLVSGVPLRVTNGSSAVESLRLVRRPSEQAIDRRAAVRVASEARRIAPKHVRCPWTSSGRSIGDGVLWILQARPMTALPPRGRVANVGFGAPTPAACGSASGSPSP